MSFTVHDVQIRRDICGDCRDACPEHRAGRIDHANPGEVCPRQIWHAWGASAAMPDSMSPVPTVPSRWVSLVRTFRGWRRAGLAWIGRSRRREVLPVCRACEWHRVDARTGLVACAAGCNCGVAAVAVIREGARCKVGRWPA